MKRKSTKVTRKRESIGIPSRYTSAGSALYIKVDDLLRLRKQHTAFARAMATIGVEIAPPSHMADGYLFVPTYTRDDTGAGSELGNLQARILSAAGPNQTSVSTTSTPATDLSASSEPGPAPGVEAMPVVGTIPVELLRQGPPTLRVGGQTIPFSCGCPPPDPGVEPSIARSNNAWIDRVGTDVHLLDAQHRRTRVEEPSQLSSIGPGDLVAAECCKQEKVLIAGPDAFRVQRGLELPDPDEV